MRALVVLLVLTAGCNRSTNQYRSVEDGFQMAELAGWTESREKGSVVFRGPANFGLDRNTVVVRSVPLERVRPHAREAVGLARATAAVLGGLPASEVSKAADVRLGDLTGARFEVTFEAPGADEPYRRTQIALVGDQHVFHLMHTAPAGALAQTATDFDNLVASFEEITR